MAAKKSLRLLEMSCCPGIRCKNTGSGYVKPDGDGSKELDNRMKDMLEARRRMDENIWARPDEKVGGSTQESAGAKEINSKNNRSALK
jgi:hypothetical protein